VPYLSVLEVCSRRCTIQIHVYLYLYQVHFWSPGTTCILRVVCLRLEGNLIITVSAVQTQTPCCLGARGAHASQWPYTPRRKHFTRRYTCYLELYISLSLVATKVTHVRWWWLKRWWKSEWYANLRLTGVKLAATNQKPCVCPVLLTTTKFALYSLWKQACSYCSFNTLCWMVSFAVSYFLGNPTSAHKITALRMKLR